MMRLTKRPRFKKGHVQFLSYLVGFMLLKAAWWIGAKFGSPTLEQIIFHLQNGTDGIADADPDIFRSFAVHVIFLPCVFAALVYGLQQWVNSSRTSTYIRHHKLPTESSIGVRSVVLGLEALQWIFSRYLPIGILLLAAVIFGNKIAIWSFLQHQEVSTFIDDNYVFPKNQHIKAPGKKLNLVLIYVESLEKGYTNAEIMGRNLLAPLDAVTLNGQRIDNFVQTTGTGWTIAGIVSTQCGVPLKTLSLFSIHNQKAKIKSFLPGIDCLGDVLEQNGYKNIFMGGASLYFADKGKFFAEHGYSELYGKEEWVRAGAKQFSDWGLYDDELFARAKTRLDQLQKSRKPFNLTLLTVDTHPPQGYVSPTCARQGVKDYQGLLTCTAGLIADFIGYMKQKGYLENTVVVILGDHLSTQAPLESALNAAGERLIYNAFLAPTPLHKTRDTVYHFAMFPSILQAMRFSFDNNRLALGASAFGPVDPAFIVPNLTADTYKALLAKTSRRYLEFWEAHEDNRPGAK